MLRFASLFVLAVGASVAFAQSMPMGLTAKTMLVAFPEIKKELKITKEQDKQIKTIVEGMRTNPDMTGGMPDMHYTLRAIDKKIVEVIDDSQKSRLQELFLQENGFLTLTEPDVSEQLALPEDSQKKAIAIIDKLMDDVMANLMESQKKGKIDMKALDALKVQAQADIKALLTPEHEEKWKTMLGQPFKFPKQLQHK